MDASGSPDATPTSASYRFCPLCGARRDGDMPYCGGCAYAFPAGSPPPGPDPTVTPGTPDGDAPSPATIEPSVPVNRRPWSGWWTPTKVLITFGIVVAVLIAGGFTIGSGIGSVTFVLLNPIFWIAAALAAVALFRLGRSDLAGGLLAIAGTLVIGSLYAFLFFGSGIAPAQHAGPEQASPDPREALYECTGPWHGSDSPEETQVTNYDWMTNLMLFNDMAESQGRTAPWHCEEVGP